MNTKTSLILIETTLLNRHFAYSFLVFLSFQISFGSPSDGELQKGDIILKIKDKDASRLSHQSATDLIVKSGSTIKLVVAR